jgi:predicted LPLAT superfamily acyltransferase
MAQHIESVPWYARPEAGDGAGLWLVEGFARLAGRRAAHLFVAPIAAYFMLVRSAERQASREFLTRVLGRPAGIIDVFRHFYTFARVAVDRVFLLSPRGYHIPVRVTGQQKMEAMLDHGRGCILLGAHLGSFEAARQVGLINPKLRLRLLLNRTVNRRLIGRLERIDPEFAANIIDAAAEPLALSLQIGECLRAGEWVGWLGDRHRGDERTISVRFLGAEARFPASPFIIARLFRVPVFLVLAKFDGWGYQVAVEELAGDAAPEGRDRDSFVREHVALFANRLEHHVRSAPYNWFNFYAFWNA